MVGKKIYIMKQLLKFIIIVTVCINFCYACGDSDLNDAKGSKEVPAQVKIDSIRNLNGKSIIFYTRPGDVNYKYLRIVYQTDTEERVTSASLYTDSVIVEGFGIAGEFEAKLYSVSAGESYSDPVVTKVNPLTPPFTTAFDKLQVIPTFGGIRLLTENTEGEMLTFYAYKKNEKGEWDEIGAIYTVAENIQAPIRGLDAVETEFGVIIKDRWGHRTEMLEKIVTPFYEEQCDKSKFNYLRIDNYEHYTQAITILWDGVVVSGSTFMNKVYSLLPDMEPTKITIDLGKKYKLSRLQINGPRATDSNVSSIFTNLYPRDVDLWGRNDDNTNGFSENDPSWIRLTPVTSLKRADGSTTPSGSVALTTADIEIAKAGHEVVFDEDAPPVRYVCFRCLHNYDNARTATRFQLGELTFFGTPEEKIQ